MKIPPCPDVEAAVRYLHSKIHKPPAWPTPDFTRTDRHWSRQRRADVLDQLERRSPHWAHVPKEQRAVVIGQIQRIASIIEDEPEEAARRMNDRQITHIYLRHGLTTRPLGSDSDIDLLVVTDCDSDKYWERSGEWHGLNQPVRCWHVGYINRAHLVRGVQWSVKQKTDAFRSVCLFGEDFFPAGLMPPPLAWLSFMNQLIKESMEFLYDIRRYSRPSDIDRGQRRAREAMQIAELICPGIDLRLLERVIQAGRSDLRITFLFDEAVTRMLWECYHRIEDSGFRQAPEQG